MSARPLLPVASLAFPAAILMVLLGSVSSKAFGQASQNSASRMAASASPNASPSTQSTTKAHPLEGTGEQMRVIAAVCDVWEKARKNKSRLGGPNDSPDIRDYTFQVTSESTSYRVTLRPRKPVVKKVPTPAGIYQQNESSTFFYEVRRSDFKIVNASMIM